MAKPLGISLSGGGVRGIAHIGVLQALAENDLHPAQISGASAGALVGALYAAGHPPADILKIFKESSLSKLFKVGLPTTGLADNKYLMEVLADYIKEDSFEALEKKLHVSVTNMTTGQYEIISEGELFKVLAASASIPILFNGWEMNGDFYVDGGVLNNLPIEPLLGKSYPIIGVNVTPIGRKDELDGLLTVGYRAFDLVMWGNVAPRIKQCDIILQPQADDFALFDVKAMDEIYQRGYDTAMSQMETILSKTKLTTKPAPAPTLEKKALSEAASQASPNVGQRIGNFFRRIPGWFGN